MEAGMRCYGGPGLLWMYCPVSVAGKFRECLHDFLFYGPEDGGKNGLDASPRSTSRDPLTFDSGLNSVSQSSHSESHLSSSQPQPKMNSDSGIDMSPPPFNLTAHPSLRRRSNDGDGSVGYTIQRAISQDITTSQVSSSSQLDLDLQFPYNCVCETPSSDGAKSGSSNEQLDGGFRPCGQQLSSTREQCINPPIKPRTESAPAAQTKESDYVHMNSGDATSMSDNSNYVNHVIPVDIKPPVENYENTGFNDIRVPPIQTENLANAQEQAPLGSYKNHALRKNIYVNNIIKPLISEHKGTSGAAAPAVRSYENVQLDPSVSPRIKHL